LIWARTTAVWLSSWPWSVRSHPANGGRGGDGASHGEGGVHERPAVESESVAHRFS
jgi:hypothetical protein